MTRRACIYDVFFCYSWKDKGEADALVRELSARRIRGRRLRVFQDDQAMEDYDLITPEVESALAASRCLVVLYSEHLLTSSYCRFELRYALSAAHRLDGTPQRVMPILRNMEYEGIRPGRLGDLRLPHPRTTPREDLLAAITARVARTDSRVFGDAPEPPEPVWHPSALAGTRHFHGRDIELWEVYDALHSHRDPGLGGASVARLTGLGGQGKTMLAEQYARQFAADYPGGVFVLRGFGSHLTDTADRHHVRARRAELVAEFVRRLELDTDGLDLAGLGEALRRHLAGTGLPYLWIVDDLPASLDRDSFMSLLAPTADGHTLITTRYRLGDFGCPWGAEVRLTGLDPGAALDLLTQGRPAANRAEQQAATALSERLGRLPLALAVAGALAAQPDQHGYQGLLDAIGRPGPDVLELGEQLWGELPSGHRASIAATMLRSVGRLNDAAREVLRVASLLAPTPLPQPLVEGMLVRAGAAAGPATRGMVTAGFADAADRSLAQPVPAGTTPLWSIHTMVSRTLRFADLDHARRAALRNGAVEELTSVLERSKTAFVHRSLVDYLPHVYEAADTLAGRDVWHLFNETGRVHVELGDIRTALACYERLYRACRDGLGAGHQTTLTVLAGLGVAHGLNGDHRTALTYKQHAHEGLLAEFGPDDSDVLTAHNNLAVSYSDLGEESTARDIYRQVYRTRRRLHSIQHPETLTALNNYAISVGRSGNHRLALRLKRLVHERTRVVHGADHPATLDVLNNVAASAFALGERQEAHEILTQVHEARARVLGADHPDTLTSRENMAVTAATRAEAVPELRGVYLGRLRVLGPSHPDTVRVLRALLEWTMPRDAVAAARACADPEDEGADVIVLTLLALRLQEGEVQRNGPGHPQTLLATCYLAHGLALQGPGLGAQPLIEDAAAGLRTECGSGDPRSRAAQTLLAWIEAAEKPGA